MLARVGSPLDLPPLNGYDAIISASGRRCRRGSRRKLLFASFPEFRAVRQRVNRRACIPHYADNSIIVSLTAAVTLLPIMIAGDGREGRRRRFLPLALSTTGSRLAASREIRHCKRSRAPLMKIRGIDIIFLNNVCRISDGVQNRCLFCSFVHTNIFVGRHLRCLL